MDHQEMADFLERLRTSLRDAYVVRATLDRNKSNDSSVFGTVESLKHGLAGATTIEIDCPLGRISWEFQCNSPALEVLSEDSYKLRNGPSRMILVFTK